MNSLDTLFFPDEYFFDEVREGFFVSSMMKRYWAAQLKVLSVIDEICKKHDIRWFAYSGTLLGAVRHGGYIPWDDDLDICMLRNDYIKFCNIVSRELPEGYLFLNLHTEKEYELLLSRVVNSRAIDYTREHLEKYYGCPYTIGIDVFPLDGLYTDEEKEKRRFSLECKVMKAGEYIGAGYLNSEECKKLLKEIESERGEKFDRSENMFRQILLLLDELFAECPIEEAEYVTLSPACIKDGKQVHKYQKKWFDTQVILPFENIGIPAPAYYHKVLEAQYGRYNVVRKGLGIHNYPVYKDQEQMLKESMGHNPYRYTFSEEELEAAMSFTRPVGLSHYEQVVTVAKEAYAKAMEFRELGNEDAALKLLAGCEKLAASVGKNIEDILKPSRTKILFVVSHFEWWPGVEYLWKQASADSELDVTVLVVPYYIKDSEFNAKKMIDDSPKFRGIVPFVTEGEYNIAKQLPDIVVIQDPYDGWNMNFTVPERYYSENIRKVCKKLVYCPFAEVDDPSGEKDTIFVAMKSVIEQPGLIYADEVLIESDKIRKLYIDSLTEMAGEKYRDYWSSKIIDPNTVQWIDGKVTGNHSAVRYRPDVWPAPVREMLGDSADKKIIIYYTCLDHILRNGRKAVDKIKRSLDIMEKGSGENDIVCVFSPQMAISALDKLQPDLFTEIEEAAKHFETSAGCIYDREGIMQEHIEYADAYYGVESYLCKKCITHGISAMIEKTDI